MAARYLLREEKASTHWKVLQTARERVSKLRQIHSNPVTSGEFLLEKEGLNTNSVACSQPEFSSPLNSGEEFLCCETFQNSVLDYTKESEILLPISSSDSEDGKNYLDNTTPDSLLDGMVFPSSEDEIEDNEKLGTESDWEYISDSTDSEEETLDQFLKHSNRKISERKPNIDDIFLNNYDLWKFKPYSSLTDHLVTHYCSEENTAFANKNECEFNDEISLKEKLPLMEVMDTLIDINKVLKVGRLSPRMERILEYKQDDPFSGYVEEEVGCCQWLIFKLEQALKRFHISQWPN